jgi:hypothetical protein
MSSSLSDIVEIRETGMARANDLLEQGYRLIAVEQVTNGVERTPKEGGATFYVNKRLAVILCRPPSSVRSSRRSPR